MNRSYIIAAAIAAVATIWVASGVIFGSESKRKAEAGRPADESGAALMSVQVKTIHAERITRTISAQGHVEPNRAVTLRAETAAPVDEIIAREGASVATGDVIVRLAMQDRQARLAEAEASVEEWTGRYEAAERLLKRGHQSERQRDEAYSGLQEARAKLAAIKQEIENVTIRAPYDGILEKRMVERGDYASVGTEIATIVDNDPLIVVVQIAQQDIASIQLGAEATVTLATGNTAEGTVRFVGARADQATRTFRVEIRIPNPGNRLRSGISSDARIPIEKVSAHFLSPSLLTLDDEGVLGIKTVDENDTVAFHPVKLVQAEPRGVWVSGLPDEARVITVGQGFVRAGERVRPVPADDADGGAGDAR